MHQIIALEIKINNTEKWNLSNASYNQEFDSPNLLIQEKHCTRPEQASFCEALRYSLKPTLHSVHESTNRLYHILWVE